MIRIAVFTTVWERPQITYLHFSWMHQFKKECRNLGLEIRPFYVLSESDSCLKKYKEAIKNFGYSYHIQNNRRLSVKSQAGLKALKEQVSFDWLMHLDSDEFLSMPLMNRWKKEFNRGTKWFGSSACYFVDIKGKAWEFEGYPDHPVKNGGTCLAREILEVTDWTLWPLQRQTGLNVMERKHIEEHGYRITPINTQDCYGVIELKGTKKAIHDLKWFKKRQLVRKLPSEQLTSLSQYHSILSLFF